ncbi:ribosomal RNA-processing protein 8 [Hyposmocoma kahamanoa]|uniref:ribosomal RNA-processing protein 8 n=1 Tax=Hyposmocoma kahamanoa TaxID=1477025 RepID=UPI000E6D7EDE|nr:ribosomal RNA-processing protein 8 [Hyposmocoma kahamanoa]
MFKIPDWEADISKTHVDFLNNISKKKAKRPKESNAVQIQNKKNSVDKKLDTVQIQPKVIIKNKQLRKKQLEEKKVNTKSLINGNINHLQKKQTLNVPVKIAAETESTNLEEKNKSPKKRKANDTIVNEHNEAGLNVKVKDLDFDRADELIVNAKKKKLNQVYQEEDKEEELFPQENKNRLYLKKQKIKQMLVKNNVNRNSIKVNGNDLRTRMLERLKAAQFRYINEKLYTSTGSEAKELFQSDPSAFQTYHQGYQLQVKKWPVNPLDVIVKKILKMPKSYIIADMGCGEATLSKRVPHAVRSFDLVSTTPGVEVCDMARTPLLAASVDVAVYCLALMGTDLTQYLVEANRILKMGGQLQIAEVESRFDNVESFAHDVEKLGFKLKNLDKSHKVFFFMQFVKIRDSPKKKNKLPSLTLKPCLYKRR